jgi:hypothetical protein
VSYLTLVTLLLMAEAGAGSVSSEDFERKESDNG